VPTVRRLVVFVLLFVLVLIGAAGVAGLLERLFTVGTALAGNDVGSLARSLAFGLVGGSIAAVLWWLVWRRQGEEAERSSVAWGLYVSGVYIVALITSVTAVLGAVSQLIGLLARGASGAAGAVAEGLEWRSSLATGVVWAAVWAWHRWMWQHGGKGPRRLDTVPALAGSVFGLLIGAGGAVTALGSLLDAALRGLAGAHDMGSPWWVSVLQSLIWAGGGFVVWWWHWVRGEARRLASPLDNVAAAVFGVLGGCIMAVAGAITVVFVLLRLVMDRSEEMLRLVDPLGSALAAAAVGAPRLALPRGAHGRAVGEDAGDGTAAGIRSGADRRGLRCGSCCQRGPGLCRNNPGGNGHAHTAAGRHQCPGRGRGTLVEGVAAGEPPHIGGRRQRRRCRGSRRPAFPHRGRTAHLPRGYLRDQRGGGVGRPAGGRLPGL
jgi:hypothetical protein